MHHKQCLDCGRVFATADPDVALCPACFRAYIAQEEGEGPARVFDADYADGYADSWYAVAGGGYAYDEATRKVLVRGKEG